MKKTLLLSIVALFINIGVNAQNDSLYGYYYAGGVRNYWQEDFTSANIIVGNTNHFDSIIARLGRIFNGTEDEVFADDEDNNIIVNSNSLAIRNIPSLISDISLSNNDIAFFTFAKRVNGRPIWLTNEAYVKVKDSLYYSTYIQPILLQHPQATAYYEGDNEYRIVCPTDTLVVTLANRMYDTAYVKYSTPDYC